MRVIRCVTIVSREVFFFLRLCGFVSLITELRDCPLRKQPKFCDATNGFPAKFRVRNERRNSILMTRFSSDWLKQICHTARPMRSTGICARSSDVISRDETRDGIPKTELIDILVTFLFPFFFRLKS